MVNDQDRGENMTWGHICAVLAASTVFALSLPIFTYFFRGGLSAVHPFSEQLFQLLVTICVLFVIVATITFFTSWFAVFVVFWLARRLSISNVWYYVACGTLISLILSPLGVILRPRMAWDPWPDPPFLVEVLSIAYITMPSGAVGGLVFWWKTGRFIRTTASPAAGA
jgi:hypothetical protein